MSDIQKQREFFEKIKSDAMTENDAAKLEFANTKLAELEAGADPVATVAVEPRVFEHVQKFGMDFDGYAETGSTILNDWAEWLLNNLRLELHTRYQDQIEQLTGKANSLLIENEALISTNQVQDGRLQQMAEANMAMVEEKNRYKLEAEDYKSRFEAATDKLSMMELEQAEDKQEIERLKRRETEFQEKLARKAAIEQQAHIDVPADGSMDPESLIRRAMELKAEKAAEQRRQEEERLANRPKIINKRWEKEYGVGAKTVSLAELVGNYPGIGQDGETIRIGTFDINKYQEVSNEEARFLREQAQSTEETATPNIPLAIGVDVPEITEDQFRDSGSAMAETAAGAENTGTEGSVGDNAQVSEAVSRAEFEAFKQEVAQRFARIEG